MIPEVEQTSWMIAAYWILMFPVAVLVVLRVTNFWADDGEGTVLEAVRAVFLMGLAVFLAYDLSGYLFARLTQMPQLGFVFPEGYTYWNWIQESLSLKRQVLGFVPTIRYLPVLFAVTAGGTVLMWLWEMPFRQAVLAFICQIILTVFAMAMLSLVFSFFVGVREGATATQRRDQNTEDRVFGKNDASSALSGLPEMQDRAREIGLQKSSLLNWAWEQWQTVNRLFEPMYALSRPVTRYLPLPVRDFLHGGGWLIAGPALAIFGWYIWRVRQQRYRNRSSDPIQS